MRLIAAVCGDNKIMVTVIFENWYAMNDKIVMRLAQIKLDLGMTETVH